MKIEKLNCMCLTKWVSIGDKSNNGVFPHVNHEAALLPVRCGHEELGLGLGEW